MAKGLKSYHEWLGAKLSDPDRAAKYLNAAAEDSEAMFLKALRKVAAAQSRSMTDIADACGISRESLYRMLSETGNPTSENRRAILAALGLKSVVVVIPKSPTKPYLNTETASNNLTAFTGGPVSGNSSSGTLDLGSAPFQPLGSTAGAVPVRRGPMSASGNFASIGYLEERTEQTGVRH